ncbi:MAG: rhodanese-like domain-containing protein, partial [Thermomicrobiales bacterium]
MPTFRDMLSQTKAGIAETNVTGARKLIDVSNPAILDVREDDEVADGMIPNATHIPRGYLELRVEQAVSDKSVPLLVYCAGGTRSALAAKSLADLGYSNVVSLEGGFDAW